MAEDQSKFRPKPKMIVDNKKVVDYFSFQRNVISKYGIVFDESYTILRKIVTLIFIIIIFVSYGIFELIEIYEQRNSENSFVRSISYYLMDVVSK